MTVLRMLLAAAFVFGGASFGKAEERPKSSFGMLCTADFLHKEVNYLRKRGFPQMLAVQQINAVVGDTVCDMFLYRSSKVRQATLINVDGVVHEIWQLRMSFYVSTTAFYSEGRSGLEVYLYGAIVAEGPLIPIPVPRPERKLLPMAPEPPKVALPPEQKQVPEPEPWSDPDDEIDAIPPDYLFEIRF